MTNCKCFGLAALSLALVLSGLGCSNTAEGLEKDTKENTQKAAVAAQQAADEAKKKAPDVIAEVSLTPPIKLALAADKTLTDASISVSSDKDAVTLSGTAKTDAQKQKAEADAREVLQDHKSSQKLVNNIQVKQ